MRRIMFSIMLLFIAGMAMAQPRLSVVPGTPGLSDTVIAGSTVTYLVTVENTGNMTFSDTFAIYVGVLDTGSFIPTVIHIHPVQQTQILVGDTNTQMLTHTIDTMYFKEGNNTVVIWPVSGGSPVVDSLYTGVFVIYFADGIEDKGDPSIIKTYPNPVSDYLKIVSETGIEQVRIFDLSGRLVMAAANTSIIDVSGLPAACYIVEIKDKKGAIKRVKVFKN